ncbi:MAG: 16S rRNA (cytosine(1402)-N(4))-methyltransferase [Bacteroidetes bacterium CG2_30_32_10]|nr:MAG: 16S rRNA (cytosine(1402)-N(4))-methyltransferase [Bacteroidetes bacterium CG2_30_32_10]
MMYHSPALLNESIEGLSVNPEGIYVDVTYGGGGHSIEILKKLTKGKLIGFDQDEDAIKNNNLKDQRFELINDNFKFLKNNLKLIGIDKVDGIIADLGISSHQIDVPERGFSTRYDAELDLRMDRSNGETAKDIINTYTAEQLKKIFSEYGELKQAYKIAITIDSKRKSKAINTIYQLKEAIQHLSQRGKENKFFAQVFQALRIEVNDELKALKELLIQANDVLKYNGRLVVISYHSLEDRLVKNYMKSGNFEGLINKDFYGNIISPFKVISKKPIIPTIEEVENNNRSRSAKLRIAQKI